MEKLTVIPKKGLKVFNPRTGKDLAEKGAKVTPSNYWDRRISSGEVKCPEREKAAKADADAKAKAKKSQAKTEEN